MRLLFQSISVRFAVAGGIADSEDTIDTAADRATSSLLRKKQARLAAAVLLLILNAAFFPFIWGKKTLLSSSNITASVMPSGAFGANGTHRTSRFIDEGSPGWFLEPSVILTHKEYFSEKNLPLWDPYRAFGTPFAATMQPQPYYPLTFLLALH